MRCRLEGADANSDGDANAGPGLFAVDVRSSRMSADPPSAEELREGMTVRIVQEDEDVHSTESEPLVGEVGSVLGESPQGPKVKLMSGAVGHVRSVETDE